MENRIKKAKIERLILLIAHANARRNHNWLIWLQDPHNPKYINDVEWPLGHLVFDVKDNFVIKGIPTTAGSKILSNYYSSYTATVVSKLLSAGASLLSKSNMDELGHSGTGFNSVFGDCLNPHDINYMCGGSSGGGAGLVAANIVDFSLVSDTGDSARIPAINCGVHGFKPSWGSISRYGLIPYAPSLDTPSIIARSIATISAVFSVVNGFDINDITTTILPSIEYHKRLCELNPNKLRILIPKRILNATGAKSKEYYDHFHGIIDLLKERKCQIHIGDFIDLNFVPIIYQIIANCEAISSSANLTGLTFGNRCEQGNWKTSFLATRTKNLSIWTKFRWINGAIAAKDENFFTVYRKALRARRKLVQQTTDLFRQFDVLLIPTNIFGAPLATETESQYFSMYAKEDSSTHLILANLTGIPSATVSTGVLKGNKLPIGVAVYAKRNNDLLCLQFANLIENLKTG